MAAMDEYLLVGGEDGSFTFMNLHTFQHPVYDTFTNGEVNGIEMSHSRTGGTLVNEPLSSPRFSDWIYELTFLLFHLATSGPHAFISTNDSYIRCVDLRTLQTPVMYPTDWYVNVGASAIPVLFSRLFNTWSFRIRTINLGKRSA